MPSSLICGEHHISYKKTLVLGKWVADATVNHGTIDESSPYVSVFICIEGADLSGLQTSWLPWNHTEGGHESPFEA
jgi:hypothetical protein